MLKIDSIIYADTKDETIDNVTICNDGKATAFHLFRAPAFGTTQSELTKWNYNSEIEKSVLSDLRKIIRRTDIAQFPKRLDTETDSPINVLIRFTIFDQGSERTIALHVPYNGCGQDAPKMPKGGWDIMCLFADLYDLVKGGVHPPEKSCGCRSLHEMAMPQRAGSR